MNYSWVNGVETRCRCGQEGVWFWGDNKFTVSHPDGHTGQTPCRVKNLTKREEAELRKAKGKKRPY